MNEIEQAAADDKLLADLVIPYVGMPATYVIGSDQYAGKLVAVSPTRHRVTWQRVREDGFLLIAHECTRRRNGTYYVLGSKHGHLKLGVAKTVLDEGF
jgi:hypothetical protein